MKKWIFVWVIAACLCSVSVLATETQASTTTNAGGSKTITLSLDTIEQIMTDYSPSMKKIVKDRDAAKSQYSDIKSQMNKIQDGINKTENLSVGVQLTQQYEALEDSAAKLKLSYNTAQEQYRFNVYQQVNQAKQQYLVYTLDAAKLRNMEEEVATQKQTMENAKKLLENGYLASKNYDTMTQSTSALTDSLQVQQSLLDADARNLRVLLGVPENAKLVFAQADLSTFDFAQISKLDLEKDTQDMLQNSVQLKNAKLTYESYRDNDYAFTEQEDAAKIAWEQAQTTARESMKTLYQTLQDGYRSLLTVRAGLASQQSTLIAAETKYAAGYLSAKTLDELRQETANRKTAVQAQEVSLYSNLLSYQQMQSV